MSTNQTTRQPRVLYVVSLFPCWSETFIVREIRALGELGVDVSIASLKPPSEDLVHDDARALCDRVIYRRKGLNLLYSALKGFCRHPLKNSLWKIRILKAFVAQPAELAKNLGTFVIALDLANRLASLSTMDRPDRIHAHWATYPSTAAMILADNLEIPFGFTAHAHDIFVNQHMLTEKLDRADAPVTISRFNIDFLEEKIGSLPKSPIIVHCGVETDEFAFDPTGREPNLIGTVGRLDGIKGYTHLVAACEVLHQEGRDFQCMIIGDGPLREKLQQQIDSAGLAEKVHLVGSKPQNEVRDMLRRATIFALPSRPDVDGNMDGIPVALMEAMAMGTPVLSSQVSGIPEMITHRQTGWMCEPGDEACIAEGLGTLLDDQALCLDLSHAAREMIEEQFDSRKEARKLATAMGFSTVETAVDP